MKRGFEILKTRPLEDNINITELEKLYNIKLPPLYKIFVENFILGENTIHEERLYLEKEMYSYPLMCVVYEPNRYIFAGLGDIESNFKGQRYVDKWVERHYLPIGDCPYNATIVVGTTGNEKDKIILHNFDNNPEFTVIANNIFEFVRGLTLLPNGHYADKFKKKLLYKNWGEDFWRIREE